MGMHDPEVDEESLTVKTRDGANLELRVYRLDAFSPTAGEREEIGSPLIVLFHGGHHVLGSPNSMGQIAGSLVKAFNAVVVSSAYRLAPEHPFPRGIDDAWDVLTWCAANARSNLYADPSQGFIVGGVSSGGTLSVVVSHWARDQNLQPPITGVYLAAANVRAPRNDPSQLPEGYKERFLSRTQEECVSSGILPEHMAQLMETFYQPDKSSELYGPLLWPSGHKDLPPTFLQICGLDTSRDENLIFADMLENEGVPTKVQMFPGLPHAFWGVLPKLKKNEKWREDVVEGFEWLLRR